MDVDVTTQILISRARRDVAEYATNPDNVPDWYVNIKSVEAGVYIVLLTAKGQEFDRQRGIDAGADLYMTKPFDPDALLMRARDVLGI
ncbi:MAG: response regulator [Acidimicrobiia bacterium]